jgi:catalase
MSVSELNNTVINAEAPNGDPSDRVIRALDENFGRAPTRRAVHAKGVVAYGSFRATSAAKGISRAGHLAGEVVDVVARFSNFPGGASHPDPAPESNPRGLAVQFRLPDGSSTDLVSQSINGFPSRTVGEFIDFLMAIAPSSAGPGEYLSTHPAAAAFVGQIQTHGTPVSYATLEYFAINAFRFTNADGDQCIGRYAWEPATGRQLLSPEESQRAGDDYLTDELRNRLSDEEVAFSLNLTIAEDGDVSDDATIQWPRSRRIVELGTLRVRSLAEASAITEDGLLFDPTRLVDGITLSGDPLLEERARAYAISSSRRHESTAEASGV